MTTVADLRKELIELGLTKHEADDISGKQNLINKIEELQVNTEVGELFDNIEPQKDTLENLGAINTNEEVDKTHSIKTTDPGWQEYALSHLEEDDKINGHPKADSLRRLTELLLGDIVDIDTKIVQCPTIENNYRATAIVKVTIEAEHGIKSASGSADVGRDNTDPTFSIFPVATAETRAEGRAYRKLLRLVNVVTAEEVVDESKISDPTNKIDVAQEKMIENMCKLKLDIDVVKFLDQYDIEVVNLSNISKSKATELCKTLSSYQEIGVPENLKGYKPNWRE